METPSKKILVIGIVVAILFWFFDAAIQAFVFKGGGFRDVILTPDLREVWLRLVIMALIIGISAYSRKHILKIEELKNEFETLAVTDKLTKAYNRAKFDEIMNNEIERAKRFKHPLSMVMFDIDKFKKVNDTHGHAMGDHVLTEICEIVRSHSRKINHLIRWGGDEFIIVPIETPLEGATILAERLRESINSHLFGKAGKITASFGLAQYQKGDTEDSFLKRVDDAVYKAKKNGGDCIEVG